MATDALRPQVKSRPHPGSRPVYRPVNRTGERAFFAGMAILLCAVVVVGFSRTYFMAGLVNAPLPNLLVHIHGAAFSLWMVLFLVQTALISAKRVAWHRSLGTIAFCLPPIMIVLGTITSIDGLRRGVSIGPLGSAPALAISMLGMVAFAVLIWAGWRARRRPGAHKRLVLIATLTLTEAAIGRFPWRQMGMTPAAGAVGGLGILVLLVVVYDLVALHRIHRTTTWAAPFAFALGALSVPIGMTPVWGAWTRFLAHHVAPYV